MSNYINDTVLIGAGYMSKEYCRVLKDMHKNFLVIGRGTKSALDFEKETGIYVERQSIKDVIIHLNKRPSYAIVAVNVDQLKNVTLELIDLGIPNILVEKPAGMETGEIEEINQRAVEKQINVFVAYNRRFYASVEKALEIINKDGGVSSFNFEFTEWAHIIDVKERTAKEKEAILFTNSSHVIDLAFFLGGKPKKIVCFSQGSMSWHSRGSMFCGAGETTEGALFSYSANWDAPGRWGVEILTHKHRLYFRPLEKLSVQELKSVEVKECSINNRLDLEYKAGVYKMCEAFFNNQSDRRLLRIDEQASNAKIYKYMRDGIMA